MDPAQFLAVLDIILPVMLSKTRSMPLNPTVRTLFAHHLHGKHLENY